MIKIRKAKLTDIDYIKNLDDESTTIHKKFDKDLYTISNKLIKEKIKEQIKYIKGKNSISLVAEERDKVIGYCTGYIKKFCGYNIGIIQDLVVTKKHRNKGIGKKLIKEVLIYFKDKQCIISEIMVNSMNLPAIKSYESARFRVKEHKMQIKLDKTKKYSPFN